MEAASRRLHDSRVRLWRPPTVVDETFKTFCNCFKDAFIHFIQPFTATAARGGGPPLARDCRRGVGLRPHSTAAAAGGGSTPPSANSRPSAAKGVFKKPGLPYITLTMPVSRGEPILCAVGGEGVRHAGEQVTLPALGLRGMGVSHITNAGIWGWRQVALPMPQLGGVGGWGQVTLPTPKLGRVGTCQMSACKQLKIRFGSR